jgi:hypothetical protein
MMGGLDRNQHPSALAPLDRLSATFRASIDGSSAAGMIEAAKGFRRLKAWKQLPILKAPLRATQNRDPLSTTERPRNLYVTQRPLSKLQHRAGHPRLALCKS